MVFISASHFDVLQPLEVTQEMSLSYKQRLELTIFGYIRMNFKADIIDDIKRICLNYYTKIEIMWDVFNEKMTEYVSDDQLEINFENYGSYRTFASSIGWNEGIHSFTIEISPENSDLSLGIISSEYIPSIASNEFDNKYFVFCENKEVVGYSLDNAHNVHEIKNGKHTSVSKARSNWVPRSSIAVVIDCDDWKLKYFLDGEMKFKSIDIVKDKIYHPVICDWSSTKIAYKLVETTVDISKQYK